MNNHTNSSKELLELEEAKKLFDAHNNVGADSAKIDNSSINAQIIENPVSAPLQDPEAKNLSNSQTHENVVEDIFDKPATPANNNINEPVKTEIPSFNNQTIESPKPVYAPKPEIKPEPDWNRQDSISRPVINNQPSNIKPKQIPSVSSYAKQPLYKVVLFWLSIVVLAFAVGFFIVNGPAFFMKLSYLFSKNKENTQIYTEAAKVNNSLTKTNGIELANNHLIIPKINVDAPIIWNVAPDDVNTKMLEGIVHYNSTSLPDQMYGNVFLTGHSSNFWWIKSSYNQVFALLPKLEINDKIVVTYNNVKYVYQVYDRIVVSPDKINVLEPIKNKTVLSLMSCVPLGTNINRLIVRAELLYSDKQNTSANSTPASSTNSNSTNSSNTNTLNPNTDSTNQNSNSDLQLPNIP